MELQEGLAEAGGEGRSGLGDTALGAGELGGEAAQEVVLRLLGIEDGNRRKHTESIGAQEDDLLGCRSVAVRTDDVVDVVDRVAHAGVLGDALVIEVDLAGLVHGDVLQEGVATDGVVDIGLGFLVQFDDLGIAAAFKVEDALVVPAVLVVADQETLRVGGKGGLAGAGETEEDGGVLAVHIGIGRAVHGGDALQREVVVHHGEHTLLHLTTVPGVQDNLLAGSDVESDAGFAAETQLLVVLYLCLGGAVHDEIGFLVEFLLVLRTDEHVGYEVGLPGNLHDEADLHAGVGVRTAETVHHEEALSAELLLGEFLYLFPGLLGHLVVVVGITLGGPPDFAGLAFLGGLVIDNVLVFGGTAGIDAGHHVDGTQFGDLTLVITFQTGFGLLVVKNLIGRVVKDFLHTLDPILA